MDISGNFTKGYLTNHSFQQVCPRDTEAARIVKMFFLSVVLVMSLFGNLLVILVVCRNRNLRRTINYFILNIAVSDIIIPLIAIPMMLANLARDTSSWMLHGPLGVISCKLMSFLADVCPAVSIISLIFMTLDRFLAVVFPLRVTLMNAKRRYFLITLTWIISIVFFSPYFYAIQLIPSPYVAGEYDCLLNWSSNPIDHIEIQKAYSTAISITFLVIPFMIITTFYAIILIKTRTPAYIRSKCSGTAARLRQKKTSRRLTIMAFLIVFVFGLCWGPYNIILFLLIFVWKWKVPSFCDWSSVIFAVQFLSYSNAAINPCVYFGFIKNFRRGLISQFTTSKSRRERRNKMSSETMLCSIQNNTIRNTLVMTGPECETCL